MSVELSISEDVDGEGSGMLDTMDWERDEEVDGETKCVNSFAPFWRAMNLVMLIIEVVVVLSIAFACRREFR